MDWEAFCTTTCTRLPADFRAFFALYGGGAIDDYMHVLIPPAPGYPYGTYWADAPASPQRTES